MPVAIGAGEIAGVSSMLVIFREDSFDLLYLKERYIAMLINLEMLSITWSVRSTSSWSASDPCI